MYHGVVVAEFKIIPNKHSCGYKLFATYPDHEVKKIVLFKQLLGMHMHWGLIFFKFFQDALMTWAEDSLHLLCGTRETKGNQSKIAKINNIEN